MILPQMLTVLITQHSPSLLRNPAPLRGQVLLRSEEILRSLAHLVASSYDSISSKLLVLMDVKMRCKVGSRPE